MKQPPMQVTEEKSFRFNSLTAQGDERYYIYQSPGMVFLVRFIC
jgi:hypothetical protein